MEFVGIVAEYDPFHNGHAAQLAMLRSRGAKHIAVCMSAGATQRGGVPILPEGVRAAAALAAGAELVAALPAPYACAGAEAFAAAGVALLTALGCDTLAFGAETPDTAALLRVAALLEEPAFSAVLKTQLADGRTFAAARAAAAETLLPGAAAILDTPNNILGVEYCKAILRQGSPLAPLALPRLGAGHGAPQPAAGPAGERIASAGALRGMLPPGGDAAPWAPYVPEAAQALYTAAAARGELADGQAFSIAVLSRLRGLSAAQLGQVRGVSEGLEHRLAAAVRTAGTVEELYAALKTKRYPHARLRRLALDAALGYTAGSLPALPPYLHILGARRSAMGRLAGAALPASPSLAGLAGQNEACAAVAAAHSAACDFSALCRRRPMPAGLAYTAKPVLL